mmetsp:Transcript_21282/g.62106  ORF Transcript_21282/g.62106 Transcript_21282/m.62106 type:complete len:315 (-) Transcript_21282:68-1012(-)
MDGVHIGDCVVSKSIEQPTKENVRHHGSEDDESVQVERQRARQHHVDVHNVVRNGSEGVIWIVHGIEEEHTPHEPKLPFTVVSRWGQLHGVLSVKLLPPLAVHELVWFTLVHEKDLTGPLSPPLALLESGGHALRHETRCQGEPFISTALPVLAEVSRVPAGLVQRETREGILCESAILDAADRVESSAAKDCICPCEESRPISIEPTLHSIEEDSIPVATGIPKDLDFVAVFKVLWSLHPSEVRGLKGVRVGALALVSEAPVVLEVTRVAQVRHAFTAIWRWPRETAARLARLLPPVWTRYWLVLNALFGLLH